MIYLSVLFFVVAVMLFILSSRERQQAGIPIGRVIYSDTSQWNKVEKALYDPHLGLAGRPDYLVSQGKQVIPIEVKSGTAPQTPYSSHIYQLAAYCLLVEHEYGIRPILGYIHYPNKTYSVDFSPALEKSVKVTIREMQGKMSSVQVDRSHMDAKRCLHCGYRSICNQALRI